MKQNNPPAFPHDVRSIHSGEINGQEQGMTLRDYFANSAMKEHMTRAYNGNTNFIADSEYINIAKYSYDMADAMLKQREL